MSDFDQQDAAATGRRKLYAKIVVFLVVVLIAWLKPRVEAWLAEQDNGGTAVVVAEGTPETSGSGPISRSEAVTISDAESGGDSEPAPSASPTIDPSLRSQIATAAKATQTKTDEAKPTKSASGASPSKSDQATSQKKSRPLPKLATPPGTSAKATAKDDRSHPDRSSQGTATKSADPPPGKLTLIRGTRDEFRSTAGLMYVPGSADGHRLKHVLKHAKDDTSKPVHGVFKGDRDQILAWIDRAYVKGKNGGKGARVENEGGRTVYTVDLGETIGFVGGQVGERKGHPPCRFLKLVIQGRHEVVTAYPSQFL